jgi:uncharacterized protein YqhQ
VFSLDLVLFHFVCRVALVLFHLVCRVALVLLHLVCRVALVPVVCWRSTTVFTNTIFTLTET